MAKSLKEQTGSWNAASMYEAPPEPEPVDVEEVKVKRKVEPQDKRPKQASLFDF